jgi:NADPH-dependent 2,4-dienoyl-CoA reductase/sulfur reductase-like enzyme
MGRESVLIDIEGDKKDRARKVLVVGGGLAGLEAARRSAFSGHKVVLCESRDWIGGQIKFAAMIPGRHEIADTVPWYERQLARHGVEMRLGTEVDAKLIDAIAPDVVIVATGSVPSIPQNMTDMLYSAGDIDVLMSDDILEHGLPTGNNILVIGGDQIGLQMADYLSEGGRNVVVAEAHNHFAQKMAANDRWYLTARTIEKNVQRIKNVRGVDITDAGVSLILDKGPQPLPGIDTIVFASERRSVRSVAEIARDKGIETHVVGDAADAVTEDSGTIFANIAQAYDVARNI